jgi:Ca2+:H+ antiporter
MHQPLAEQSPAGRRSEPRTEPGKGLWPAAGGLVREPLYWLLIAIPVAAVLSWLRLGDLWVFMASALAVVPLAGLMGRATESLAHTLTPAIGGMLNATFGNAAELILALFALSQGEHMYPLVKASITGSVIGNVLLVMGASIVAGGCYYKKQRFNRSAAGVGATMLALASVSLIMPALYYHAFHVRGGGEIRQIEFLSDEIAGVLALIYVLYLIFTLFTHHHLFGSQEQEGSKRQEPPEWRWGAALTLLALATAGVAWMSHLLVGAVEQARTVLGMNEVFTGVIIVAVVGNAAEHSTAVLMAVHDKMDATVQIAVGSGIQIALFVAPILVLASFLMGHEHTLDLHFTLLETITVVIAVFVLALVCHDGETHWIEGAMMLGVYTIIALAFYNLPG